MLLLSQNRSSVILGPMEYNKRYFTSVIKDDLDIDVDLPAGLTTYLDLGNNLELFPVSVVYPEYNSKIQQLAGPFFTYNAEDVVANYTAAPKNVDAVKNELKQVAAANRYAKEVAGVDFTVQGQTVKLLTSREDRNLYLQALQLGAADISWKFDAQTWLTLSLVELGDVVTTIMNHVKTCFEEEAAKATEIDACTTLEQLDAVEFPVPEVPGFELPE